MVDDLFADPRLAAIYDALDPDRSDLAVYVAIVAELGARSVLDVGCGTGVLACRLAGLGIEVVGLDPAVASLDIARAKPGAERVRWILGDVSALPVLQVDLAVMTGNVAQVFVDDADWTATLAGLRAAIRPGGHLVLESRVPARRAWEEWTRDRTWTRTEILHVGVVESWCDVLEVTGRLVTFRWTYVFAADGATLTSDSTLVFRGRDEIESALAAADFDVVDVGEAADRPGREHVFVARAR